MWSATPLSIVNGRESTLDHLNLRHLSGNKDQAILCISTLCFRSLYPITISILSILVLVMQSQASLWGSCFRDFRMSQLLQVFLTVFGAVKVCVRNGLFSYQGKSWRYHSSFQCCNTIKHAYIPLQQERQLRMVAEPPPQHLLTLSYGPAFKTQSCHIFSLWLCSAWAWMLLSLLGK